MFVLIVGCGRAGSALAKNLLGDGNTVSVLDESAESHRLLDVDMETNWEDAGGMFTVGTALEIDALVEAGIENADAFVAGTNGDNTNLVIAQIAQRRFNVPRSSSACLTRAVPPGTPSKACTRFVRPRRASTC